jgi:hypothetical protein
MKNKLSKILGMILLMAFMPLISANLNYTEVNSVFSNFDYYYNTEGVYSNSSTIIGNINGSIDEVMIFNSSLSQTEVEQIYNSTYSRFYPTGEMLFEGLDFGVNNTVNITLDNCQTLNGSSLQGKINDGTYQELESCSLSNYEFTPTGSDNLTLRLNSGSYGFYSPLVVGNITLDDVFVQSDTTAPTIIFESPPTPEDNSYVSSTTQTITANISDESNTSSFIDFDKSLVGYWGMDYSNATGVFDNSSYNNFGSFAGGAGESHLTSGKFGDAFETDSVDGGYIDLGSGFTVLNGATSFTVSTWIYKEGDGTFSGFPGVIGIGSSSQRMPWIFGNTGAKTLSGVFETEFGVNDCVRNSASLVDNSWNHVVLTWDGSNCWFVVNNVAGTKDPVSGTALVNTDGQNYIGKIGTFAIWNGSIDEMIIFNRSLSTAEISALYNSQANKFNATFNDLSDGQHNYTLYAIDSAGNLNSSSQSFSFDGTYPLIEFVNGTEDNATSFVRDYIFVNVSVTESNEDTISFGLYNSTDLVNLSSFTDGTREINFTSLEDGTYYYNVSVNDSLGNLNSTETREITLDTTAPLVTVQLPVEGNTYTVSEVTFQVTTNENSTCEYSLNSGVLNSSLDVNSNGTIHTATQTGISNAAYTVNYYCDDLLGNSNNTQNSTFTVSVSSGGTGDTGGGSSGGGGGGGPAVTTPLTFSVNPESIERTLAVNRIELGQIDIVNNRNESVTYNARVEILSSMIAFEENSITLEGGESGVFDFKITPLSETGIYTGKIIITGGSMSKEIPVIINIRTEKSLYDLILTIPRSMKVIDSDENLFVQIDLLQMGIREKMDVTLNYVIKDYSGKVYLVESETIAVENQKTHEKEFHTQDLPDGEYVLGVELIYPDGVAVASSQFRVGKDMGIISNIGFAKILILGALIFVLVIVFLIARRYRRLSKGIKGKK